MGRAAREPLEGRLGVSCYCVTCNMKYRAQSRVALIGLPVVRSLVWRAWWATAELTPVTAVTSDSSFLDARGA